MKSDDSYTTSVVIPVSTPLGLLPLGPKGKVLPDKPGNWVPLPRPDFEAELTKAFRRATALANWAVRRMFKLDADAAATDASTARKVYLYKEAAHPVTGFPGWAADWSAAMASAQCVLRAVQQKYVREWAAVHVRHDQSMLSYKFPQPFPVHNRDWGTAFVDGGDGHGSYPTVILNLPGVGKVKLRLKRDAGFHRQAAQFRALHDGVAAKGAAALYRNRKGQVLMKMVGSFAREERGDAPNVCYLHTDPNALLVAEVNGRSVTVTNADHLRRAMKVIGVTHARHKSFLERARQDKKREVRVDRARRRQLDEAVERRCDKNRARVKTAVQQVAAQVVRFCERQRVGLVCYDDACRRFLPAGFEWFALKETMTRLFVGKMGRQWVDGEFAWLNPEFTEPRPTVEKQEWLSRQRVTVAATAAAGRLALAAARRKGSHPKVSTCQPPPSNSASARP